MAAVLLAGLIVVSALAIAGGKGAKWKLLNLIIILGSMGLGLFIGYVAGMWGKNMEIGAAAALPLSILLGLVAAIGCLRRNKTRGRTE
jgi:hypothetical protein